MKHFKSKSFHFFWITAVLLSGMTVFYINKDFLIKIENPQINFNSTISELQPEPKIINDESPSPTTYNALPATLLLPVPFTPQAPTANWDELHNEACEEASVIMAVAYFIGLPSPKDGEGLGERLKSDSPTIPAELVEKQISKLTDWQIKNFGYYLSITSEETAQMIEKVFNLKTKIIYNFSLEDIKKELAQEKLILFPVNGRLLENPYYKTPGPIYHMIVLKGYDNNGNFISNDPGTKRGLNYPYSFNTLYKANGNYNHDLRKVNLKQKNIIVIEK